MELRQDTILLVCDCERGANDILDKLYESGLNVVGPAPNAAIAMALAAQSAPTIALVVGRPNGRRDAGALAKDLLRTWGIRSWIIERDGKLADRCEGAISTDDHRISHIRRALDGVRPEGRAA